MNIFEFSEKYKVPLRKARKMEDDDILKLECNESEHGAKIRYLLARGQPLPVPQILAMIECPSVLRELGHYREKAENQLAVLGDVKGEAAPREIAAYIANASRRDRAACGVLVCWMKEEMPPEPVTHAWFATRLLMGVPSSIRKYDIPLIRPALQNCRQRQDFADWFSLRTNRYGRNVTYYHRPKIEFDL